MYQTVAEEFLHLPLTFLCGISLLTSPKEELENCQNSKFHCSAMASEQQSDDMRAKSKYGFRPDSGYLLHSGSTLVIVIPASLRQQNQQHSIQTLRSVDFGGTFNRKRMKMSVWVRASQEARVVLLQVFIRTSCDIGIHFRNLRI